MEYQVCSSDDADDLAAVVNEHLSKGWQLQGGVSVSFCVYSYEGRQGTAYTYAQAMVYEVREPYRQVPE